MLTNIGEILDRANRENYAVPAVNVFSGLDARAVLEAAEELRSPVIFDIAYRAVPEIEILGENLISLGARASVPVAIHLDHGESFEIVMKAVRSGFTSVMLDCSMLPYEENAARVREVVNAVKPLGITVEAELGHVGQGTEYSESDGLTDPKEAERFIKNTGISALAVAVGTAHGTYSGIPKIDFDRLSEIKERTHFPLVLHGSSGSGEENIRKACRLGINKVNVCVDILHAVADQIQAADMSGNHAYEIWDLASEAVREETKHQISMTGSEGKAWNVPVRGLTAVKTSMME